jgi:hypothetical protein
MNKELLTMILTVVSVVLALYAAACITLFPQCSLPALCCAAASLVSSFNFGYLVYVQTKNEN